MEIERTVSEKGQVVIPKDVRKKLGIKSGSDIVFEIEGDKIIIKKKMSPTEFVEDFGRVPKRLKKAISAKEIRRILDEEYEIS